MGKNEKPNSAPTPQNSGPAGSTGPVMCTAHPCKNKVSRFGFCSDHHEQYKFGLIRGDGKPAADFTKKSEQYELYCKQQKSNRKAA